MKAILSIDGMRCAHCAENVRLALSDLGIKAKVDLEKKQAVCVYKGEFPVQEGKSAIENLGFTVTAIELK